MTAGNEVVPVDVREVPLFGSHEPNAIVERAAAIAAPLARVIDDRRLYTEIGGRRHVRVEGWTLLGSMLGVFPVCVWSRPLAEGGGWEARVEARTLGGALAGAAEASCMRDEPNWSDRPEYALRSMAQTRATSKALRLALGFVMALAGYEATPAEEMDGLSAARPAGPAPAGNRNTGPAGAGPVAPATEAQVKAIYAIARGALGLTDEAAEARCRERYGVPPSGLSRRQASELIEALKGQQSSPA